MKKILFFISLVVLLQGENYQFYGNHFIANYTGCNLEALEDVERLASVMEEAIRASGATILSTAQHRFSPAGFTMMLLLSESHASIHTYPEHRACFIDLFTCGESCDRRLFEEKIEEYLQPVRKEKQYIIRKEP